MMYNRKQLIEKRNDLLKEKMKLDKFFTMFLDKFERKMNPSNTNTPIWKLYNKKMKEYDAVDMEIKSTEYWINKSSNV